MAKKKTKTTVPAAPSFVGYHSFLDDIAQLLQQSRRAAARSVNAVMTLTYWEVGRRIVEFEQQGKKRADYGSALLKQLSADLSKHSHITSTA